MEIAKRVSFIKPSPTLVITKKAGELKKQGKNIISLSAGEPDFDTPIHVKQAAVDAINAGMTKYTAVDGTTELKNAIINKFKEDNNLEYNINQITVGTGGKQVLYNAIMATVNPGDEVIIAAPYWVSYPDIVNLAEGKPIIVECPLEDGFKLTPEKLEKHITPKTKWLILNSPNNPSGAVYSKDELQALADVLLRHPHVYILSDDIYEYLVYGDKEFHTIAAVEPKLFDRTLTMNGVSKSYSMTGWRIGYAGGPENLIKAIMTLQSQSTSNPCSISQAAALAALSSDRSFLKDWVKSFKSRRDKIIGLLNKAPGINCTISDGAFYVLPDCRKLFGKTTPNGTVIKNSEDFVNYLLDYVEVAVVHGSAFGIEGYFRISYVTSDAILEEAGQRIIKACSDLK